MLRTTMEADSAHLANRIIKEVDWVIKSQIDDWSSYLDSPLVHDALVASNSEFASDPRILGDLQQQETVQSKTPEVEQCLYLDNILGNEVSRSLQAKVVSAKRIKGFPILAEVFITNAYGANIAQTAATEDCLQSDEHWWQHAVSDGTYVSDVELDESAGVDSIDICIRISDAPGTVLGVAKIILDIRGIKVVLQSHLAHTDRRPLNESDRILLLSSDRTVIFSLGTEDPDLTPGSEYSLAYNKASFSPTNISQRTDSTGKQLLVTTARSQGYGQYRGLHWMIAYERDLDQVIAPVTALRKRTLLIVTAVSTLGLSCAVLFSLAASRRLATFKNAAQAIRDGNLAVKINTRSKDELAELAGIFNGMADVVRTNEARANAILLMTQDVIVTVNGQGIIETYNHEAERVFGWSSGEAVGQRVADLLPPIWHAMQSETQRRKLSLSGRTDLELEVPTKHGRKALLGFTISAESIGNKRVLALVGRDIGERKSAESALQNTLTELREFNALAVGRELRMIELKKEVNELLTRQGSATKYVIDTAETLKT